MPRTTEENTALRVQLAGGALAHTNEALVLQEGESFVATYDLSGANPTVNFSGTLRLTKDYDPPTYTIAIAPS